MQLFDAVITVAKKPHFYREDAELALGDTSVTRPFRRINTETGHMTVEPVRSLKRGEVYGEGSLQEFKRLLDLHRKRVLYFGDHISADLGMRIYREWNALVNGGVAGFFSGATTIG